MKVYKNLNGTSGVAYYELGGDSITVQFKAGSQRNYLYTNQSAGPANVRQMQVLAEAGRGLGSFINTAVKNSYERKW